jgi:kynurenine formamidase
MTTYDLTHPLSTATPTYPGDPPVAIDPHATMTEDGYRTTRVSFVTHAGTHVDAPAHTEPDGKTLDEFPVAAFRFDAAVVDCTDVDARSPITADRLAAGDPPPGADALLVHTGWDDHWGTDRYRDHPFLAPGAAEWLVDRDYHVGLDTFSPDPTPPAAGESACDEFDSNPEPGGIPAHHELLGAERFVVENLCGLDRLPDRSTLHAYPLAIEGADGSPVRAVAVDE